MTRSEKKGQGRDSPYWQEQLRVARRSKTLLCPLIFMQFGSCCDAFNTQCQMMVGLMHSKLVKKSKATAVN